MRSISRCESCIHATTCQILNSYECENYVPAVNTSFNVDKKAVFVDPERSDSFIIAS